MTSLTKYDKVVRRTGCATIPVLYGEVIFWGSSKNGRLMVVCEAPDGAIFVSDPSHLEKVIVKIQQNTDTQDSRSSG